MAQITIKKGIKVNGVLVVPCSYDDIKPAIVDGKESETIFMTIDCGFMGLVKVRKDNESYGYTVNEEEYTDISDFENDIAIVSTYCERFGTKYGLINSDLEDLTGVKFDKIRRLSKDYFEVVYKGCHGVVDSNGNEIVACTFESIDYDETKNEIKLGKFLI